eukprot:CAMPEP_0184692104 /NCGR_PEP_ID=MMETSP0313-20130426/719_1 /TAXON_ID=2792 /ORGANISM="Porphyridium aerugineum, Strain SAG 1380-2" /LENGTH=85 /DNA_ID=CAMNT_0027149911 /DNA_START=285 /DNA_END=542 /DNA_ORIENTATION=+
MIPLTIDMLGGKERLVQRAYIRKRTLSTPCPDADSSNNCNTNNSNTIRVDRHTMEMGTEAELAKDVTTKTQDKDLVDEMANINMK